MRTLTVVPIIHTQKEFGILEGKIQHLQQRAHGISTMEQLLEAKATYWIAVDYCITKTYAEKPELLQQLHIFIDSLPVTSDEILEKIIRDHRERKFPMYVIAAALREKGAHIHGTENPHLLIEEHAYWKGRFERDEPEDVPKERRMLQDRDAAIAARINAIVPDEESALLFIAALHRVRDAFHTDPHWTVHDL